MASTDKLPEQKNKEKTVEEDSKKPITSHVLVPSHRLLSGEEKDELLTKFDIKLKQLPKISVKDPVVKLIPDSKVGDVLEIKRSSTTAGEAIYYRVIV